MPFGRTLDRPAEIDCRQLLGTIACQADRIEDLQITSVHADTTSFSVYGEHGNENIPPEEQGKYIRGFSKDYKPHLKQLKFGLMVTDQGFPIVGE